MCDCGGELHHAFVTIVRTGCVSRIFELCNVFRWKLDDRIIIVFFMLVHTIQFFFFLVASDLSNAYLLYRSVTKQHFFVPCMIVGVGIQVTS